MKHLKTFVSIISTLLAVEVCFSPEHNVLDTDFQRSPSLPPIF